MVVLADDEGRLRGNPVFLRSQVFPYEDKLTVEEVKRCIKEVVDSGLINYYSVNEQAYISHPNWFTYQTLRRDRMAKSTIPLPDGNQLSTKRQPNVRISKEVSNISKKGTKVLLKKYKPKFLDETNN